MAAFISIFRRRLSFEMIQTLKHIAAKIPAFLPDCFTATQCVHRLFNFFRSSR